MRDKFEFDEWENWEEEDLMEFELSDEADMEDEDEDEMFEFDEPGSEEDLSLLPADILNEETFEILQHALNTRDAWFLNKKGNKEAVSSNDMITFHEFMKNTKGICKWEKDFFHRIKLYHPNN